METDFKVPPEDVPKVAKGRLCAFCAAQTEHTTLTGVPICPYCELVLAWRQTVNENETLRLEHESILIDLIRADSELAKAFLDTAETANDKARRDDALNNTGARGRIDSSVGARCKGPIGTA